MRRYQALYYIHEETEKVTGFKGFLIHQVLPVIKDLLIEILVARITDRQRVSEELDSGIKRIPGVKGFLVYQVWPLIRKVLIDILTGETRK